MTNQEPGAPEPLTTVAGWLWNAYHADEHEGPRETCPETLCRKVRAALSHPESDTRGLDVERLARALNTHRHVPPRDWPCNEGCAEYIAGDYLRGTSQPEPTE